MSDAIQSILVLLIVTAAGGYVVRRSWQALWGRKPMGCHGCSGCGPASAKVAQLVALRAAAAAKRSGGR